MLKIAALRVFSFSFIATLLVAIFMSQAQAADGKVYPGSNCVRYAGSTPSYSWSRIGNPSTTTNLYLDCPFAKDHIGFAFDSYWMRATDLSSASNVTCRLYSVYRSGGTIWFWSGSLLATSSAGFSTNEQHISGGANVGANNVSHAYFSCKIPPQQIGRSYISSYSATEF